MLLNWLSCTRYVSAVTMVLVMDAMVLVMDAMVLVMDAIVPCKLLNLIRY